MKSKKFIIFCTCFLILGIMGCASKETKYSIEKDIKGKGIVDVVSEADGGTNVDISIQAEEGYVLSAFTINGTDRLSEIQDDVYTIQEIAENIKIRAEFEVETGVIYATEKPTIDGKIDSCWDNAAKLYANQHYFNIKDEERKQSTGYVSLMWDENNLYLLGVVEDIDIVSTDRINFWISETYITAKTEEEQIPFSSNPKDGMYYSVVNPYGKQFSYSSKEGRPVDFAAVPGYECQSTRFRENGGGYIVEIKIPKQSAAEWAEGYKIGFDVSIDTYFPGEENRAEYKGEEMYCYWKGVGKYWEHATALGCLILCK